MSQFSFSAFSNMYFSSKRTEYLAFNYASGNSVLYMLCFSVHNWSHTADILVHNVQSVQWSLYYSDTSQVHTRLSTILTKRHPCSQRVVLTIKKAWRVSFFWVSVYHHQSSKKLQIQNCWNKNGFETSFNKVNSNAQSSQVLTQNTL